MSSQIHRSSQGQSLVIVALLLVVLIGMLALTLDGGYAYLQRRAAQTAADAGALAGAYMLCETGDSTLAWNSAREYAIDRNEAEVVDITVANGVVTVEAYITFSTFFGRIFNRDSITAAAIAAAECTPASALANVLPIGYACPPEETTQEGDVSYCGIAYGETVVIMDTDKLSQEDCLSEGGTIDCDPDGDENDELKLGGSRAWLYLAEQGNIGDWMPSGFEGKIYDHTWFQSKEGTNADGMAAFMDLIGVEVALPIYNAISDGYPPTPYWDDPSDTIVSHNQGGTKYYHVITFAKFIPTCVQLKKPKTPEGTCVFYDILEPIFESAGENINSYDFVEGHFEEGTWDEVEGGGTWYAGIYAITLIR